MKGTRLPQLRRFPTLLSLAVVLWSGCSAAQGVSVTTWHNDNWRTGQNDHESAFTTSGSGANKVSSANFGLLGAPLHPCRIDLTGFYHGNRTLVSKQIYAQPLVVADPAGNGMTVYVVTLDDVLYSIKIPNDWDKSCADINGDPKKRLQIVAVDMIDSSHGGYWTSSGCTIDGHNYPACYEEPADCCTIVTSEHQSRNKCPAVNPAVGILGTPAIAGNTLYVVTESAAYQNTSFAPGPSCDQYGQNCCNHNTAPQAFEHRLHALDLTSGSHYLTEETNNGSPVLINPAGAGNASAWSQYHINRPGLLFVTGPTSLHDDPSRLYVGISMMDGANVCTGSCINPIGWVLGYDVDLTKAPNSFQVTNTGSQGGGIWMDGAGLSFGVGNASTLAQYLYVTTSIGQYDGTSNFSNSFLELTPDLSTVAGYFTPADQEYLTCGGYDFGSTGIIQIPDRTLTHYPYLAMNSEKLGNFYVIDRTNPGGYNGAGCTCSGCSNPNNNLQTIPAGTDYHMHTTAAYWSGIGPEKPSVYVLGNSEKPPLSRFELCDSSPPAGPICNGAPAVTNPYDGFPSGATPTVSWNGKSADSAIVWAIYNHGDSAPVSGGPPGSLVAFAATDLQVLYDSSKCTRDVVGYGAKFSVPTVANGLVFVGTLQDFDIFGLYGSNPPRCNP